MATQTHQAPIAPDQDAWKLFVFRKALEVLPAQKLVEDLNKAMQLLAEGRGSALDTLVRAGELETALADAGYPEENTTAYITDSLAALVCGQQQDVRGLLSKLERIRINADVRCSFPEGFSYYGLNPLDFSTAARSMLPLKHPHAAVIGIRSVGSTLSAVVSVSLRRAGTTTDRITVRPRGEPYNRNINFNAAQLAWLRKKLDEDSEFLIVDEGPGFSGSTILSAARALEQIGVGRHLITIICSRAIDDRLRQSACGQELTNYRMLVTGYGRRVPVEADCHIGNGRWRSMFYKDEARWPACWTDLERIKHLSVDQGSIFKFEGLGRFGALAESQARILADAGFSPALLSFEDGFAQYSLEKARPLERQDLNAALISRIAEYCTFRTRNLTAPARDTQPLLNMLQVNLEVEFACKSPLREVPLVFPVYPDCRMMPHEWLARPDGRILKTDSVGHGEGHQIPGPVDIAWDLAGAIIEWRMPRAEGDFFLHEYQRISGDDAAARIRDYLLLYCAYRMAHCRMGAACMQNYTDGVALWKEYQYCSKALKGFAELFPAHGCLWPARA